MPTNRIQNEEIKETTMNLTAAMTNLCGEIGALRQGRETFMENLRKETRERRAAVSEIDRKSVV